MPISTRSAPDRGDHAATFRPTGFLMIYSLAYAGGVVAYLPLLGFLLPIKIEALARDSRIDVLTICVIGGAVAASLSNILFGILSDRSRRRGGGRRRWIAGGVVATAASYTAIVLADTPAVIAGAVVVFQIAVNMMLAPMGAILADEVPDTHKGLAGALLSVGAPAASALSALLVGTAMGEGGRLAVVGTVMALCVVPLLMTPRRTVVALQATVPPALAKTDLAIIWAARLAVQVAGNAVTLYLLYYFQTIQPGSSAGQLGARAGQLLTISLIAAVPVALVMGRVSDRWQRRKPPLILAAILAALGLAGMASANDWTTAAAALIVYQVGSATFVALLSGFAILLLPSPDHHGRDLGLINLTNTLPGLLGPVLAWLLATPDDFGPLFLLLAALTAGGGLSLLAVRGRS